MFSSYIFLSRADCSVDFSQCVLIQSSAILFEQPKQTPQVSQHSRHTETTLHYVHRHSCWFNSLDTDACFCLLQTTGVGVDLALHTQQLQRKEQEDQYHTLKPHNKPGSPSVTTEVCETEQTAPPVPDALQLPARQAIITTPFTSIRTQVCLKRAGCCTIAT